MTYFIDTEFIESGPNKPIHLISIGIVSETGNEYYAVNSECPFEEANEWVAANVLPHINASHGIPLSKIREDLISFCGDTPVFWGYYADYDWVVFCQIFGTMVDLPKGWPRYCRDIKQWCDSLGNPKLPLQLSTEHNALNDARYNRQAFHFLDEIS